MAISKSIPIIDIGPYLDTTSSEEARDQVIEEVRKACSQYGFLQIKGHGVPVYIQQQMLQCCKTFFDLPVEQKEALSLKNSPSRHGYQGLREQTLDKRALPDDKEGFYIGREEPIEKGFRQGPNQWPALPPASFRDPVTNYYNLLQRLAHRVMELLVQGLGHPVTVLENFTKEPVMNLKLLHYPPVEQGGDGTGERLRFGAGEHTDFGAITLLLQQPGKDGLQVYDAGEREWIAVPAVENVLVVNMGDLVQKWTDGEYRSTVHRVLHTGNGDRYSVPSFYEGNYRSTNPFKPNEQGGETVGEHVKRKFDSSHGLTASRSEDRQRT